MCVVLRKPAHHAQVLPCTRQGVVSPPRTCCSAAAAVPLLIIGAHTLQVCSHACRHLVHPHHTGHKRVQVHRNVVQCPYLLRHRLRGHCVVGCRLFVEQAFQDHVVAAHCIPVCVFAVSVVRREGSCAVPCNHRRHALQAVQGHHLHHGVAEHRRGHATPHERRLRHRHQKRTGLPAGKLHPRACCGCCGCCGWSMQPRCQCHVVHRPFVTTKLLQLAAGPHRHWSVREHAPQDEGHHQVRKVRHAQFGCQHVLRVCARPSSQCVVHPRPHARWQLKRHTQSACVAVLHLGVRRGVAVDQPRLPCTQAIAHGANG